MTQQNINLYTKLTKPRKMTVLLSWRQFWLFNAIFTGLMISIYIVMQMNVYILYTEHNSKLQTEKKLQKEFLTVKRQSPDLFFSQNIAKSLGDLQKELSSGERFLNEISTQVSISSYLTLLANTILPDMWLTEIKITDDGNQITLKGYSLTPSSIQQFMQSLISHESLVNHILSVNGVDSTGSKEQKSKATEFEITMTKKQT